MESPLLLLPALDAYDAIKATAVAEALPVAAQGREWRYIQQVAEFGEGEAGGVTPSPLRHVFNDILDGQEERYHRLKFLRPLPPGEGAAAEDELQVLVRKQLVAQAQALLQYQVAAANKQLGDLAQDRRVQVEVAESSDVANGERGVRFDLKSQAPLVAAGKAIAAKRAPSASQMMNWGYDPSQDDAEGAPQGRRRRRQDVSPPPPLPQGAAVRRVQSEDHVGGLLVGGTLQRNEDRPNKKAVLPPAAAPGGRPAPMRRDDQVAGLFAGPESDDGGRQARREELVMPAERPQLVRPKDNIGGLLMGGTPPNLGRRASEIAVVPNVGRPALVRPKDAVADMFKQAAGDDEPVHRNRNKQEPSAMGLGARPAMVRPQDHIGGLLVGGTPVKEYRRNSQPAPPQPQQLGERVAIIRPKDAIADMLKIDGPDDDDMRAQRPPRSPPVHAAAYRPPPVKPVDHMGGLLLGGTPVKMERQNKGAEQPMLPAARAAPFRPKDAVAEMLQGPAAEDDEELQRQSPLLHAGEGIRPPPVKHADNMRGLLMGGTIVQRGRRNEPHGLGGGPMPRVAPIRPKDAMGDMLRGPAQEYEDEWRRKSPSPVALVGGEGYRPPPVKPADHMVGLLVGGTPVKMQRERDQPQAQEPRAAPFRPVDVVASLFEGDDDREARMREAQPSPPLVGARPPPFRPVDHIGGMLQGGTPTKMQRAAPGGPAVAGPMERVKPFKPVDVVADMFAVAAADQDAVRRPHPKSEPKPVDMGQRAEMVKPRDVMHDFMKGGTPMKYDRRADGIGGVAQAGYRPPAYRPNNAVSGMFKAAAAAAEPERNQASPPPQPAEGYRPPPMKREAVVGSMLQGGTIQPAAPRAAAAVGVPERAQAVRRADIMGGFLRGGTPPAAGRHVDAGVAAGVRPQPFQPVDHVAHLFQDNRARIPATKPTPAPLLVVEPAQPFQPQDHVAALFPSPRAVQHGAVVVPEVVPAPPPAAPPAPAPAPAVVPARPPPAKPIVRAELLIKPPVAAPLNPYISRPLDTMPATPPDGDFRKFYNEPPPDVDKDEILTMLWRGGGGGKS